MTYRHMKVVRSSAPRTGRLYLQEIFLVFIFTRGWVDPRAMVRSEGNMSLKNPVTPPGIDPGTVRLVAQRLDHYATPGPLDCRQTSIKASNINFQANLSIGSRADECGWTYRHDEANRRLSQLLLTRLKATGEIFKSFRKIPENQFQICAISN
jgi:hypothetical protein